MSWGAQTLTPNEPAQITSTPLSEVRSVSVEVTAPSGRKQKYRVGLDRQPLVGTSVKAFNSRAAFRFGASVAIDGDTAVIGAPGEDGKAAGVDGNEAASDMPDSGAAYVVFRRADGQWVRQAYLKAESPEMGEAFGSVVAIDGDTIAVGAPGNFGGRGVVYVFARTGSAWSEQAMISEPNAGTSNRFGAALALEGNRLIVSAPANNARAFQGGSVYSFTRTGSTWAADPDHPNPAESYYQGEDGYGYAVSLAGDRVAVSERAGNRSVLVLVRSGTSWRTEQAITVDGVDLAEATLALDRDTLAAATPGAVHLFTRSGSSWVKQASVTPVDTRATLGFATSLALAGDLLAVGSGCSACQGGLSTFVRDGDVWKPGTFLTLPTSAAADAWGAAVAISGNRIVVGAPGEDSSAVAFEPSSDEDGAAESGAAYIAE